MRSLVSTLVHGTWTQVSSPRPQDEMEIFGALDFVGSDPAVGDLGGDGKNDLLIRDDNEIAIVLAGVPASPFPACFTPV